MRRSGLLINKHGGSWRMEVKKIGLGREGARSRVGRSQLRLQLHLQQYVQKPTRGGVWCEQEVNGIRVVDGVRGENQGQ